MSLERPPTRERQHGRVPMTVLDATADLLGTAMGASSDTAGSTAADGQEQQAQEPSTFRSGSGSESWQRQTTPASQAERQEKQQQDSLSDIAANTVALKVRSLLYAKQARVES